ncbi:hypothetical protein B0H10DRAFT_2245670 [Mycena sp. CBHHK59/15]|nr:hypothetical protein B0H10DRAFT_2245670 [Mycena sp. CBHHK59/15]
MTIGLYSSFCDSLMEKQNLREGLNRLKVVEVVYIASYTDVEHTLEPVPHGVPRHSHVQPLPLASRRRHKRTPRSPRCPANEHAFEDTLRVLLSDPAFLPVGGVLVTYHPVTSQFIPAPSQLCPVLQSLEGHDARICILSGALGWRHM